jgi:hypothetical protein
MQGAAEILVSDIANLESQVTCMTCDLSCILNETLHLFPQILAVDYKLQASEQSHKNLKRNVEEESRRNSRTPAQATPPPPRPPRCLSRDARAVGEQAAAGGDEEARA